MTFQDAEDVDLIEIPNVIFMADLDNDLDIDLAASYFGDASLIGVLKNTTNQTDIDRIFSLPQTIRLSQNYPNPFNAVTLITYDLPKQTYAVIEMYNLLGQRVTTLHDGFKPAGHHKVLWQADDLLSGIYFYRLQADDYSETRKMTLVK